MPHGPIARRWAALAPLVVAVCAGAGCARAVESFDLSRAQAHIDTLARRIGSRPIGSAANREAREYISRELEQSGFAVRLQEADAVDARRGLTAHVVNIIATRDGQLRDAVALVSHYDSVPDGPGASDDALGVATCLESARVLAQSPMRHSLFVIVTDGEEAGLMGARAVVSDADVASRVRTYLNFDGTGAGGETFLYESGPGWGSPLTAWAHGAPAPAGGSFAVEIYRRLPNDTDFSILKTTGASGLNFAPLGDSYAYHTDRDIATRVDPSTIRQEIGNTIGTMRALDAMTWSSSAVVPTYFDLLGARGVLYGELFNRASVWIALGLGALAWIELTADVFRVRGVLGLGATMFWAALTAGASAAFAVGAARLLRASRAEINPWFATPRWFFLWIIASALLGGWLAHRLGWAVTERTRPVRSTAAVWWVAMPVWAIGAFALYRAAPSAAYLLVWPLFVAGVAILIGRRSPGAMFVATAVSLATSVVLWAKNSWLLLHFLVTLFGSLPVVAPTWLYPAVVAIPALVIGPPFVALFAGRAAFRFASRSSGIVVCVATIVAGALAWTSPAYTATRPQTRRVWYLQDEILKMAWWEVGGSEPAIDLGEPGPSGAPWQRVTSPIPASVRFGPLDTPFAFRMKSIPQLSASPADVTSQVTHAANGRTAFDLTIVPHRPLVARLTLPPHLQPSVSTLPGIVVNDVWRGTYIAPPPSGVIAHLEFDALAAGALRGAELVYFLSGVPGPTPETWPAWLSRERTAWEATTILIEPVGAGG